MAAMHMAEPVGNYVKRDGDVAGHGKKLDE